MPQSNQSAERIVTRLLERTCVASMSGDFEAFLSCFVLPHKVETFEGSRIVETAADVRGIFEGIRSLYRRKYVTEVIRHCVEVRFLDARTISSTHESRLLRGTELVLEPYPVHSTLMFVNGGWRFQDSEYAIPKAIDIGDVILGRARESVIN